MGCILSVILGDILDGRLGGILNVSLDPWGFLGEILCSILGGILGGSWLVSWVLGC